MVSATSTARRALLSLYPPACLPAPRTSVNKSYFIRSPHYRHHNSLVHQRFGGEPFGDKFWLKPDAAGGVPTRRACGFRYILRRTRKQASFALVAALLVEDC